MQSLKNHNPQNSQYKNKEYYCANLDTVYKRIKYSMTEFRNHTIDAITLQIQDDDLHFSYKILEFSKKLRKVALIYFGTTMHNILGLWDDYLHYNKSIEEILDANLDDFANQLITIGIELPYLKRNIHRLKKFCIKKCPLKPEHVSVTKVLTNSIERLPLTNPNLEKTSMRGHARTQDLKNDLNELLKERQHDIRHKVRYNYLEIFAELNEKLNTGDSEIVNKYLPNLEEIKNEIHGLAEHTIVKLNKLRIANPEIHMNRINTLAQICIALQQDVQNMKTELNEMFQKINHNAYLYM